MCRGNNFDDGRVYIYLILNLLQLKSSFNEQKIKQKQILL